MILNDVFEEYEKNISDFISLCEDKTIVFDFDGTLTKFKYAKDRLLPCRDADVSEYVSAGGNIYKEITILKTMKYIISRLPLECVWVLTTSVPEIRKIKSKIVFENFHIPEERVVHSDNDAHKITLLKEIYARQKKNIVFVEDTARTLLAAEENLDFVRGWHISGFLV